MFTRLLHWIQEVWYKMIGKGDVKRTLNVDIAISGPMAEALQLWSNMYMNKSPWLTTDVVSMNLAAAIAAEFSRAVTIEMKVKIEGSPRADYLSAQFDKVLTSIRRVTEYGVAKGGLVFKPYADGTELAIDFIQADQFYPVSFDANGNITACIFADQRKVGDWYYTRLEHHALKAEGYEIINRAFRSSSSGTLGLEVSLASVDAWADIAPQAVIEGVDRPLFGYFKFPTANAIDPASPLGVSCYSRAVDLIKQADQQWSDFVWEFESGRRALYIDVLAFGRDAENKPILPNKRLYRTLNGSGNVADEEMFHEWSPTFREAALLNGLDAVLRRIEFECGLAYGTLSNPQTVDKTATEVKSSQQRSYVTVADTQKALENALEGLLYAMDVWATLNNLAPLGTYTTTYDFDDSIVVDKDAQLQQDLRLVTVNIMSPLEFRMRNFKEDEETAKRMLAMVPPPELPSDTFGGM